jgi:hypothetical protein
VGNAAGYLLVEDVDGAVAVTTGRSLDVRRGDDRSLVLAVTHEGGGALAEGLVDADIKLVVVEGIGGQRGVVVGEGAARNV